MRNNHSTLDFRRFGYYWKPLLKIWRNRLKIKINDRFLSKTRGITLLHSMFDVLTINGNLYWKLGRIDLKSKRLNSLLVNNSSLMKFSNDPLQFFNLIFMTSQFLRSPGLPCHILSHIWDAPFPLSVWCNLWTAPYIRKKYSYFSKY